SPVRGAARSRSARGRREGAAREFCASGRRSSRATMASEHRIARDLRRRVRPRFLPIGMTDHSSSWVEAPPERRSDSTLDERALLAALGRGAMAIVVALVRERAVTLDTVLHAVTPPVGFFATAPLGALASWLWLARSRGWRPALRLAPAQLGLAWLMAA